MSTKRTDRFKGSAYELSSKLQLATLLHMESDKIRDAEKIIAAFIYEITAHTVEECVKQESKAGSRLSTMRLLRAIPDKHNITNNIPLDITISLMRPNRLEKLKRYAKMYMEKYSEQHRIEEEEKKDPRNTQFAGYAEALRSHLLKSNSTKEAMNVMAQHFYDFAEEIIRQIADCLEVEDIQEFAKAILQDVPDKQSE